MCLEDIRIGRASNPSFTFATTNGATKVTVCPQDDQRIALTISSNGAGNVFVGPVNSGVSNTQGFLLNATTPIQRFSLNDFGKMICSEWVCFDAGVVNILAAVSLQFKEERVKG